VRKLGKTPLKIGKKPWQKPRECPDIRIRQSRYPDPPNLVVNGKIPPNLVVNGKILKFFACGAGKSRNLVDCSSKLKIKTFQKIIHKTFSAPDTNGLADGHL